VAQGTYSGRRVLVAGGGGFIGGWLVGRLLAEGAKVRVADIKPIAEWFQLHDGAENLILDLRDLANCRTAATAGDWVFNLAADMGGWVSSRRTSATACSRS
jgi:GDP-D-mannose 3',5'-epimerase